MKRDGKVPPRYKELLNNPTPLAKMEFPMRISNGKNRAREK